VAASGEPPDLGLLIRTYVSVFLGEMLASRENEKFVNLVSTEMANHGMATDVVFKEIASPVHRLMKDAILRARPGMSPERASLCVVSIAGQMFHFVRAREVIKRIIGKGYSREFMDEIVEHITDFSLKGMSD
jgi:hypothetical protein